MCGPGWDGGSSKLKDPKEPLLPAWDPRGPESSQGDAASQHTLKGPIEKRGEPAGGGGREDGMGRALRAQRGRGLEEQVR